MKPDLVSVIEAAYQVDQGVQEWLTGLLRAARGTLDDGIGLVAFTYDASNPGAVRVTASVSEGMPEESAVLLFQGLPSADADYFRGSFLSLASGASSEVLGWNKQPLVESPMYDFGIRDALVVNGLNANGLGCIVAAGLRKELRITPHRRKVLAQLSCHLGAAHRLMRNLSSLGSPSPQPEAILDFDGKVLHAEGAGATSLSLLQLKASALAILHSRQILRHIAPDQAVDEWKGLIAARWTLVDVCEDDGRRYLVARENAPRSRGPVALSEREKQVIALASMGHHNKLIAYNLGISHSTVRVLLARAARKLGVGTREDLIRVCAREQT